MRIKSLKLQNFRNWSEKSLAFEDRVLIYGPNAKGKTNILEAAYFVATTRSFRGKEISVIKEGEEFSKITASIEKDRSFDAEVIIKNSETKTIKEFRIDEKKRSSVDFVGEFVAIVFSPDDLLLISGPPEIKRRYLSFTIGQRDREYLYCLLNYKKVLRHRNELLKCDRGTILDEIDIWDEHLSENGQKIIDKRKELENFINERFQKYYQELAGEARNINFRYDPQLWGTKLRESLLNARDRDMNERVTTVGPHRDSWIIEMDGNNAALVASRGEYRTLILALKLCERDFFLSKDDEQPVILLDDVFSELDEQRRRYLVDAFSGSQLIITTTDLDHLHPDFRMGTQLINIED